MRPQTTTRKPSVGRFPVPGRSSPGWTGIWSPSAQGARPLSREKSNPGTAPRMTQAPASPTSAQHIDAGGSTASAQADRRGGPRRTSPITFTKQSTAIAIVAASAARATAPSVPSHTPAYAGTWSSACSVSHSDAKPLSSGIPAIARAPMRNAPPLQGRRRNRPPRRSSSSAPVARSNVPAPRKRSALNAAWLITCKSAAPSANAAHWSAPWRRNRRQAPRPSATTPTCSTVE